MDTKRNKQKRQNDDIVIQVEKNIHRTDEYITEAGMCLRFVRLGVQGALGKEKWPVRQGADAKEAFERFEELGWVLPDGANTIPGDIGFQVGEAHGKHGHTFVRVYANKVAENSSVHVGKGDKNALGYRALAVVKKGTKWVRIPA